MDMVEKYQNQLLEQARHFYRETPITEPTERAYLATPRHRFVGKYREWGTKEWHIINDDNLAEHAATLYADRPLILHGDDDTNIPSTISQPSFVLRMLDLLQLSPGQKVFELGAGSGWNAALMGQIVGPDGQVTSLEIIPEVAKRAVETVASLGIANVQIIEGDGGNGFPDAAPYDRAIFTAGAFDLPRHFYDQIREGGLLLAVIKTGGGGDNLFLLRKSGDHFEALESMPCGFVQVTGNYQFEDLESMTLEKAVPEWPEFQKQEVARRRFWWGGGKGQLTFGPLTAGIRSFLGTAEPTFRAFKTAKDDGQNKPEHHFFGLWDGKERSLVVAKDGWLVAYGNSRAEDRLLEMLRRWLDLGMPTAACLDLKVYPIDVVLPNTGHQQWIVKRRDSQFLWTLQA
jgi:protein-L-isoaspartate(D-aspartate) O-methyltransferase